MKNLKTTQGVRKKKEERRLIYFQITVQECDLESSCLR